MWLKIFQGHYSLLILLEHQFNLERPVSIHIMTLLHPGQGWLAWTVVRGSSTRDANSLCKKRNHVIRRFWYNLLVFVAMEGKAAQLLSSLSSRTSSFLEHFIGTYNILLPFKNQLLAWSSVAFWMYHPFSNMIHWKRRIYFPVFSYK